MYLRRIQQNGFESTVHVTLPHRPVGSNSPWLLPRAFNPTQGKALPVQLYCTSLQLLCCCETIQYLNTKCVTSVFSLDLNLTLWARGYAFQSIAKASTRVDTRARDNSASLASLLWRRRCRGADSLELLQRARWSTVHEPRGGSSRRGDFTRPLENERGGSLWAWWWGGCGRGEKQSGSACDRR